MEVEELLEVGPAAEEVCVPPNRSGLESDALGLARLPGQERADLHAEGVGEGSQLEQTGVGPEATTVDSGFATSSKTRIIIQLT